MAALKNLGELTVRPMEARDYDRLIGPIDDWFGRRVHDKLPRLFVEHFRDTSIVIEDQGLLVGFLFGFPSPCELDEAYIHFVGVHPGHRRSGIARSMYERFFGLVVAQGRTTVRCITTPLNRASIAFHTALDFEIQPGDGMVEGTPVHLNHDGPGEHRVCFARTIQAATRTHRSDVDPAMSIHARSDDPEQRG